jgi:hypothetical protein
MLLAWSLFVVQVSKGTVPMVINDINVDHKNRPLGPYLSCII